MYRRDGRKRKQEKDKDKGRTMEKEYVKEGVVKKGGKEKGYREDMREGEE